MESASAIERLRELSHPGSGWDPLIDVVFFIASSLVIIWRLEAISARGVQGTILGTLFMPYFSGLGNLLFVFVVLRTGGEGEEILINCVVNNATNITLIVGVCGLIWPLTLGAKALAARQSRSNAKTPAKQAARGRAAAAQRSPRGGKEAGNVTERRETRLNQLSLVFTMLAMLFFTGITWALASDGGLSGGDGWTLIALFLFWQAYHVFDVLKENVRKGSSWHPLILVDLAMVAAASFVLYLSVEWLVEWLMSSTSDFFNAGQLGLLTGLLMVLPNGIVAVFYSARRRPEVVLSSQFGDAHICIPLCIGLYAAMAPMTVSDSSLRGLLFIAGLCLVNLASLALFGRIHRWTAGVLVAAYAVALPYFT